MSNKPKKMYATRLEVLDIFRFICGQGLIHFPPPKRSLYIVTAIDHKCHNINQDVITVNFREIRPTDSVRIISAGNKDNLFIVDGGGLDQTKNGRSGNLRLQTGWGKEKPREYDINSQAWLTNEQMTGGLSKVEVMGALKIKKVTTTVEYAMPKTLKRRRS